MEQDNYIAAFQLAAQLPDTFEDAQRVIAYLSELLAWREAKRYAQPSSKIDVTDRDHEVVLLRRPAPSSGSSPRRRPRRIDSPSVLPK